MRYMLDIYFFFVDYRSAYNTHPDYLKSIDCSLLNENELKNRYLNVLPCLGFGCVDG